MCLVGVSDSEASSIHAVPLRKTCMGIMWSPFGLCFRPEMGPVEFFVIKLLSELGVCVPAPSP